MTQTGVPEVREEQSSPRELAHIIFRSPRYAQMVKWWLYFLDAQPVYEGPVGIFITFDKSHHRIGIFNMPHLDDVDPLSAGIAHIAFNYVNVGKLVANYERMRDAGLMPARCTNHGATTSIYYRDPDHTEIEMFVDNFPSVEALNDWYKTGFFDASPNGVEFDPEILAMKFHEGVEESELVLEGWPRTAN